MAYMIFFSMIPGGFTNRHGFTLIELIAVLIIVSITAAFVATKMGSGSDVYKQEASAAVLENHIRYVQLKALKTLKKNAMLGIKSDDSDYWWFKGDDSSTKLDFPGGKAQTMPNDFTLKFDQYGIPCDQNDVPLSSDMAITVGTGTVTVIQETGYVQ